MGGVSPTSRLRQSRNQNARPEPQACSSRDERRATVRFYAEAPTRGGLDFRASMAEARTDNPYLPRSAGPIFLVVDAEVATQA
jgi:hypothetical protein